MPPRPAGAKHHERYRVRFARSELFQEPHVVFVKEADIVDAVTEHGDAFDAEAERPAGPHFGVVADVLEDLRMHHAAAGDLQPILAHLLHECAAEIDLETRLGVAEIVRTEPYLHVIAKNFFEDEFYGALEVADGHAFVHVETFDLLERRVMRGVCIVASIDASRRDDADGRRLLLHHADLDA